MSKGEKGDNNFSKSEISTNMKMKIKDLGMSLLAATKRMKCLALQNNAPILQIVRLLAPGKNCVTQKLH